MNITTLTLNTGESLSIVASDNVMRISFQVGDSSTGTVKGSFPFKGLTPSTQNLLANMGASIEAMVSNSPVQDLTLTCTTGTMLIILAVQ